jgi:predicted AAA+ superfamily ATPase
MNLVLFLLANTGQPVSLQNLTKSLAIPAVAQTARYVEYLVDAYLLLAVPKYSASFKQRVVAPNKYYAIDNGLRRVNSPSATPDRGIGLKTPSLSPCAIRVATSPMPAKKIFGNVIL